MIEFLVGMLVLLHAAVLALLAGLIHQLRASRALVSQVPPFGGRARFGRKRRHAVYRFFDERGRLLYVGRTSDLRRRTYEHARSQPWWREVQAMQFALYATPDEAADEESYAINDESPRYNKQVPARPRTGDQAKVVVAATCDSTDVRRLLGEGGPMTPVELYRKLGVSRATLHRYMSSWIEEGWLDRVDGRYCLVDQAPGYRLSEEQARTVVRERLSAGGAAGVRAVDLYTAAGRSSSWFHPVVSEWIEAGEVERHGHGRYRAVEQLSDAG